MKLIIHIILFTLLPACTVLKIEDKNGTLRIERSIGGVTINPSPSSSFVVYDIQGLGYVSTPLGSSLGYTKQSIATGDSSCRLIVWVSEDLNSEDHEELRKIPSICIRNPK